MTYLVIALSVTAVAAFCAMIYEITRLREQRRQLRCKVDGKDAEIKALKRENAGLDERNERLYGELRDAQKAVVVMLTVTDRKAVETPLFDQVMAMQTVGQLLPASGDSIVLVAGDENDKIGAEAESKVER